MAGIALSRLHITPTEFYQLCPIEFHYALLDHQEREQAVIELPIKTMWETTRMSLFWHFNMNPYRKKSLKKLKDVFSLSWDTEEKPQTVEQMSIALQAIHAAFGGMFRPNIRKTRREKSPDLGRKKSGGIKSIRRDKTTAKSGEKQP